MSKPDLYAFTFVINNQDVKEERTVVAEEESFAHTYLLNVYHTKGSSDVTIDFYEKKRVDAIIRSENISLDML